MHSQGFCTYPLYRFDLTKLEEIDNEEWIIKWYFKYNRI
jgi:hypothetical protein